MEKDRMKAPDTSDPARNYIVCETKLDLGDGHGTEVFFVVGRVAGIVNGVVVFDHVETFDARNRAVEAAIKYKDAWPNMGPAQKPE